MFAFHLVELEEASQIPNIHNPASIREDALAYVLGPNRPGSVRGLGFGATPSRVDAQRHCNAMVKVLKDEVKNLKDQFRCFTSFMVSQGISIQMDENGGGEDMFQISVPTPQSQQDSTGIPRTQNIENSYCELVSWLGTGQVIARGQIASQDPHALVHHVLLGPDCYKVWVNQIVVQGAPLFRPTQKFFTIDDAKGSTIAWLCKYITYFA